MENAPIKKKNKRKKKWLAGIGLFLLVYLLGGLILQFFLMYSGNNEKFAGAISFVAGLIVFLWHITKVTED